MRPHRRCAQRLWVRPTAFANLPIHPIRHQSSPFSTSTSDDRSPRPSRPRSKKPEPEPAQRFEARQVQLTVDSLGEPGSVTVISSNRPKSLLRSRKPRRVHSREQNATTVDSILDDLDQETAVLDEEDIRKTIENLGRFSGQAAKLPSHDWETLRSDIATSFTYNQLSDYIAARKQSALEEVKGENPWRPGTSSFWHASPTAHSNTERLAAAQGLTGKLLLAEHILRDCWHFSVVSEVGQLDLRLPPLSITVLLNSTHFSFDEVAELHSSSIDVTSSLGLVRVTGEQEACESIRDVIQDAVARIREQKTGISVQAPVNPAQLFTRSFIDWVSQTYSVAIEQDSSSIPTKILCLSESIQDAENARRTLNYPLSEASQTSVPFSTYMPASQPANLYSQILQHPSWLDRSKAWFRWAISSTQTTSTEAERAPFFDGHQTRLSNELLKLLRKDSVVAKGEASNGATIHESVTATVGRCLFSSKQMPEDAEATLSASDLGRSSMTRVFTTEVPNLTSFLESLPEPKSKSGTGRLRLKPSSEYVGVAPELEVEYLLYGSEGEDSGHSVEITGLKSILETSSVDYLLPENTVDLRFTRTAHRDITKEILSESPHYRQLVRDIEQALVRDIASASASTSSDSLLSATLPPFCKVSLPRGLLLSPDEEVLGDSIWNVLLENNLEVEYMYPPLQDVRGSILQYYDLEGRKLSYRFYESGPFYSRLATEVALAVDIPQVDANLHADVEEFHRSVEHKYHEFYNAACDMAFKVKSANREVKVEAEVEDS
ncbi:hypothetical protein N7509_008360 [Penicillium cosmopolitanum]|uniref:Uncharacterized protein n=1 Tax=Penicillium cosmopolitanum TaxID=1131564 RepID=A0A9X0B2K0_9EURO|nr:uncharacterized protein N7509_008360 [Penicillium cosmopolitanum]KAJ5385819.1 hypothetical protein N7509_008360 [Penicillium cosmopolitanum]